MRDVTPRCDCECRRGARGRGAARGLPGDALRLACTGGEDYELVLVGEREKIEQLRASSDVPLTVVGEIVEDPACRVRLLDANGNEINFGPAGWDHIRAAPSERWA